MLGWFFHQHYKQKHTFFSHQKLLLRLGSTRPLAPHLRQSMSPHHDAPKRCHANGDSPATPPNVPYSETKGFNKALRETNGYPLVNCLIGNTSSKGPFSIAMLDYRNVILIRPFDKASFLGTRIRWGWTREKRCWYLAPYLAVEQPWQTG